MRDIKRHIFLMATMSVLLLGGCASGPKYALIASQLPRTQEGDGRIFFYRDGSLFGSLMQPPILLNDVVVGKSKTGGFFFVDVEPGNCDVSCRTETTEQLTFELLSGETKYVRTRVEFGVMMGRVVPYLESESVAMETLSRTAYMGPKLQIDLPDQK